MSDFATTTNFALKKPTVGQAVDTWGTYLNANFDAIDQELQTLTVAITTPDLEDLGNVLALTPSTDQFLRFNGESWAATTVTITTQINDLTDVDLSTSPTTNQVLTWSGSSWIAATPSAATIADNSITTSKLATDLQTIIGRVLVTDDDDSPTNGQILQYNSTDSEWKYADLPGSTVVTLSDVNSAALANDAVLVYNSTAGEFQFESGATLRTTLGVDPSGTDNSTDLTISTATSYDYIVLSAGQVLTINQVDLQTDVQNTLPVSSGGTGSTTASAARTALLPSLTGNGSKLVAVNSGATDIEYVAESTLSITESQISDFGSYQTEDAGLTSIAGLTTAADKMIYTTASDTYAVTTLTSAGRALLDDSDAAAQRTTLGLGTIATQDSDDVTITGGNISGIVDLAIADGGTGASSVSAARTNLGLGTAATTDSTDYATAAQGTLADTATQPGDLATTLNVSATDKLLGRSTAGAGVVEEITLTAAGRALLDDGDAAAQRTTLGLGTAATTASTDYATAVQGSTADSALQDVVDDSTPQLGGNLDVNGNSIVSASAGNIAITPDTTGKIILDGLSWPTSDGSADQVLKTDGAGNLSFVDQSGGSGSGSSYIEHSSTVSDSLAISSGTNRMYVGRTDFSSGGVTMAGTLVVAGGYANFTSASALNITGTLNVI